MKTTAKRFLSLLLTLCLLAALSVSAFAEGKIEGGNRAVLPSEAHMDWLKRGIIFNPQLATANVRQEVEDAVRDGRKECYDAKGNLVCRYTVEQE